MEYPQQRTAAQSISSIRLSVLIQPPVSSTHPSSAWSAVSRAIGDQCFVVSVVQLMQMLHGRARPAPPRRGGGDGGGGGGGAGRCGGGSGEGPGSGGGGGAGLAAAAAADDADPLL